jgi:hypothetical protein
MKKKKRIGKLFQKFLPLLSPRFASYFEFLDSTFPSSLYPYETLPPSLGDMLAVKR